MGDILGSAVVLLLQAAVAGPVLTPPIVLLAVRVGRPLPLLLWFGAVAAVAGFGVIAIMDMDRADATGGTGNLFTGSWLLGCAVAAASGSVWLGLREARRRRSG